MSPLTRLDHIHYKTHSFEATRQFYVAVMGAEDRGMVDLGKEGNRQPHMELLLAGATLFFAEDKTSQAPTKECGSPCNVPPWNSRHGVYHIAFHVENCVAATEHFRQKGQEVYGKDTNIVAVEPFKAADNILASFLQSPDGMAVELKEDIAL